MSEHATQVDGSAELNRSKFLAVLCALSAIHAVYGIVSGLATAISPPEVDSTFIDNLFEQLNQFQMPIEGFQDAAQQYYLNLMLDLGNYSTATFLFFSIQLIAVIMMYRLNRMGFLLYILAQIGLSASPVIFAGFNKFGQITLVISLVWNALWVIMYATQLKHFER